MKNQTHCASFSDSSLRSILVDYRVVISFVVFTSMLISYFYVGMKPRGWWAGGDVQGLIGLTFALIGLVIRSWAAGVLQKGKSLATSGPYSLCKHPLYLGSFSMMVGFCLLMGNLWQWAIIFGLVTVIYWFTMLNEERRLAVKFGDAWTAYCDRVPRFLPWRWINYKHAPFSWTNWLNSREYKALLTAIGGLIFLEVWRLYY